MAELVHQRYLRLEDAAGTVFDTVRVFGEPAPDGTWRGIIEFVTPEGRTLQTEPETTQSTLDGVTYWATGLEPVYFEGALERAVRRAAAFS
jgi:hypothetical protein